MPAELPKRRRRALALRWHLVLLVAGALLPVVLFAAVAVYRLADGERAAADRRLQRSANDLSLAVDREMQATVRTLTALAEAEALDRADLGAFHAAATRVAATQPAWLQVILLTPDGQQVVNTHRPFGTPLPRVLDAASLTRAVEQKRPAVGSLTQGPLRPEKIFCVRVPVMRGGEVRYVLTAVITPESLAGVVGLSEPSGGEWTRTVVDADGQIVARGREPARFVGERVSETMLGRIRESDEGLFRGTSVDGAPVYVAYRRDPFSGWTSAVAAPVSRLDSAVRGPTLTTLGLGLALLCLSTLAAALLSRHITRGLVEATRAAETMARGGRPHVPDSSVVEVTQLGRALAHSADLLGERERERNEHLARAEAARAEAVEAQEAEGRLVRVLRESEERFARAFEVSPLAQTISSLGTGRLLEVNEAFTRMSGYTREEALGRTPVELGLWPAPSQRDEGLAALRRGARVRDAECRLRMKDGTERVGLISAELIEVGGEPSVLSVVEDVTERRRAEAERARLLALEQSARRQAEEANRLKDEFLATVSHELRTPLTSILGWAHILENSPLDDEAGRRAVSVIRRNADQQKQIVDDILDVSRIITGKLNLESEPVGLAPVVQAALESVGPAAEAKGIRLRPDFDPAAVVRGDAQRLQQIVWNLLANAVKFTEAGGEVHVRVERLLTHARIEVSDTGAGIPAEFLPYVFDRFRQADSSATRRHGGLGLGLSIVRHLVELHGGSVHAYSTGEGQGATFTVDLPLPSDAEPLTRAEDDARLAHPARGAVGGVEGAPPPLVGLRLLVVDDDEDTLLMLSTLLRHAGAEVTGARSAAEALGELARARPDVIVADIAMPEVDGHEFIRRVRARGASEGGATPAVALTAYAGDADRARALRSGFNAHLSKPVEPADIVNTIVELTWMDRTNRI